MTNRLFSSDRSSICASTTDIFAWLSSGSPNTTLAIELPRFLFEPKLRVLCAAGNSGKSQELMYPAKYTDTISIGSINRDLKISSFSCSTGSELDFLAPGEGILSCVPDNKYANMTGTSMANPFAAGCGALYLAYCKQKGKSPNKYDFIEHFEKHSLKPDYLFNTYQSRGIITPKLQ